MRRRGVLDEIAGRWQNSSVLKRDVFSTVERGRFTTSTGAVDAVVRHLDDVPWWSWPLARLLLMRERRALECLEQIGIAPPLLWSGKSLLVRGWIDGLPLHIAQPFGDLAYFRSAKAVLRLLHRHGICHNDLAKSQNWMRGRNGAVYLIDFQLAVRFSHRSCLFRIAAYEDLRHLLKHKRSYAGAALTSSERRILARKSWLTHIWMSTGKKLYVWVTRGMFGFVDREGGGLRLTRDAPSIAILLKTYPAVREVAVFAFPDRRKGTGLYAFVEAAPALSERALTDFISDKLGPSIVPNHLQIVEALPRHPTGYIRNDMLQLVAMNQIDLISSLPATEAERAIVAHIVHGRRNLSDRVGH